MTIRESCSTSSFTSKCELAGTTADMNDELVGHDWSNGGTNRSCGVSRLHCNLWSSCLSEVSSPKIRSATLSGPGYAMSGVFSGPRTMNIGFENGPSWTLSSSRPYEVRQQTSPRDRAHEVTLRSLNFFCKAYIPVERCQTHE